MKISTTGWSRLDRNENFQIDSSGIFPCGEGAGMAGGIISAAVDGLEIATKILGNKIYLSYKKSTYISQNTYVISTMQR